jgi:ABC-2 type transport system ATP-binding protein
MKAKLGLALAITPKPKLLILDEPTAGLDPVARRDFMDIIVSQARTASRTTFFSSHLIDEVERCADRIGIIHAGKMRFQGPLSQLRSEVRRVRFQGESLSIGPLFKLWQERKNGDQVSQTFHATSGAWQDLQLPPEATLESLSLEEIFLACVGSRSLNL